MKNNTRSFVAALSAVVMVAGAARGEDAVPVYRTLPKPKVIYIAEGLNYEMWAEKWRAKVPAHVTFEQVVYNDHNFHHLCDKPLEELKEEIDVVPKEGKTCLDAALANLRDYDVIVTQLPGSAPDAEVDKTLLSIQQRVNAQFRESQWPEPASALLIGLGGLLIGRRRNGRSSIVGDRFVQPSP